MDPAHGNITLDRNLRVRKKQASFGKEFSEHRVCPAACGSCKKTNADISFTLWQVGVSVTASNLSNWAL